MVGVVANTGKPVPVPVELPVPPLATARVPASVIAPDVADAGVSPVVPPANVVTPVVDVSNVAEDGIDVPLMLVAVAAPRLGVVRLGEVERTTEPEPVEVVAPVPPPLTANGRPPILLMSVVTMQYQVPP